MSFWTRSLSAVMTVMLCRAISGDPWMIAVGIGLASGQFFFASEIAARFSERRVGLAAVYGAVVLSLVLISVCASTAFFYQTESFRNTQTREFQNTEARIKSLELEGNRLEQDAVMDLRSKYVQSRERGHERMMMASRKREEAYRLRGSLQTLERAENIKVSALDAVVVRALGARVTFGEARILMYAFLALLLEVLAILSPIQLRLSEESYFLSEMGKPSSPGALPTAVSTPLEKSSLETKPKVSSAQAKSLIQAKSLAQAKNPSAKKPRTMKPTRTRPLAPSVESVKGDFFEALSRGEIEPTTPSLRSRYGIGQDKAITLLRQAEKGGLLSRSGRGWKPKQSVA